MTTESTADDDGLVFHWGMDDYIVAKAIEELVESLDTTWNKELEMATEQLEVHKGRWGFYSVTREEYLKIKENHKLALRALKDALKHWRWARKLERNRSKTEPVLVSYVLAIDAQWEIKPAVLWYLEVLQHYRNVKRPVANPEDVMHYPLPFQYEERIARLKKDYGCA
jgi:hypothetical protein